uniref:endo-polygalacturonase n=1 Tax=Opuntia streptacantha TaxID=393608 RepID=A0A7C9FCE9_OPUST
MKSPFYSISSSPSGRGLKLAIIINIILHYTSTVAFESLLQLPASGSSLNRPSRIRVLHLNAFGAVGNGLHDDTEALKSAWELACSLSQRSLIVIPKGFTYLVRPTDFARCKSQVTLRILGAIVAPRDPEVWIGLNPRKWLYFHGVDNLTLEGEGTINGMGEEWWASSCKVNKTIHCHHAPTAITFHRCKGLKVKDIRIINGQQTHMSITNCVGIVVFNVTITAPLESPNTDGIHISASTNVKVKDTVIRTGDDCVSIVSNSSRILITAVFCGPGHGISIGSLGKSNEFSEVHDVMVDRVYLSGTRNGLRIKTWQGGAGFASRIRFQNAWMENVSNPIIIDQYYCDSSKPCKNQTSAIHVENISFINIKGTSASEEAIRFACSDTVPCRGLYLEDIQLIAYTGVVTSFCWNAQGWSSGIVIPPPCFPIKESVGQKILSTSLYSS